MKKKISVLSDSDEALLKGRGTKNRAKAVDGKPDASDVQNLNMLFAMYDKASGGKLKAMVAENQANLALSGRKLEPIDTAERLSFQMPQDLQQFVEKYYPTIWTKPEHLRWFLKTFSKFRT